MSPPEPSRRRRILEAYKTRLEEITGPNGFNTDAGRHVYVGEIPGLGSDDPPAVIAVVGQLDEWRQQGRAFFVAWPITVWALTKAVAAVDVSPAYLAIEDILADIQRAVELDDMTLGGLVYQPIRRMAPRLALPREEGSITVGVGVTYTNDFKEGWGHPE